MNIEHKPSAADRLRAAIAASHGDPADVGDAFSQAVGRRLEDRGITRVRLPRPQPERTWVDRAIEHGRRTKEALAQQEAQRQAEADAAKSVSQRLAEAIAGANNNGAHLPLNGAEILRAALAGEAGTVNGEPA